MLVKTAPRLLAQLPERLNDSALRELRKLSIEVQSNEKFVEVTENNLKMASGKVISSSITVWAAGVKAANFLKDLGGGENGQPVLDTNRLNQLLVNGNLQTTLDNSIYAFGDCAACQQADGTWVPPRAQAAYAYQQAMYLARALPRLVKGESVRPFAHTDQGSLITLAEYFLVGNLMGSLTKGSFFVEGQLATLICWAFHKQHPLAPGSIKKALITVSKMIARTHRPRIKLR